ncbi:FliG C-terminal domain-containing protein [Jannaschia sp. 2305UL9-9]|uniref:FliG C-terminal domain-containing protein n=1 Tax=Jannaschia sp. 2305UL9-9 TaxID=3121638 RepID=UPI0035284667
MTSYSPDFSLPTSGRPLTQGQKAAVIIRLLVNGGADPGISKLPKDQQRRLVREMASLRFVDRQTLAKTVAEFASELDGIGLHFPREVDSILATLDGRLSLDVVEAVLAETGGDVSGLGEAAWSGIATLDDAVIEDLMAGETSEVCAILLSKLPASKAAALIGRLPPERADEIAAAFGRTEDVTPDAVSRIGNALGRQSDARAIAAFDSDAVVRVGNILNAATSTVRKSILDRLDTTDPDFAARVRAAVFSYENIPARLSPRDVPRVLRGVENAVVVTAIAGAPDELSAVGEFLLASISSRLADQMREDIADTANVPAEQTEEAMSVIVAEIRRMEEDGEIALLAPED